MCRSLRSVALLTLLATALLAVPAAAQVLEVPTERVPGEFNAAAEAATMQLLSSWLIGEEAEARASGFVVAPTAEDLNRLESASTNSGRMLVGVTVPVATPVRFADLDAERLGVGASELANGVARITSDGFAWNSAVHAPGATALRIHFTDFSLPPGAELYVYNERGEAFGPYNGRGILGDGDFWTNTVTGSELRVQVRYSGRDLRGALANARFTIQGVGYLGDNFVLAEWLKPDPAAIPESFCSFNASCVQNASCSSIPSAIQSASDAVAHLQFAVGSSIYICSGGLLNDTDSSSTIPYLLTANHCFSTSSSASSLEAFFQFTTSCGGSCYNPDGAVPRVAGSTLLSTSSTGDYTLVRLSSGPPAGSSLLGWNAGAVAFSNGTSLYRLSHPKGAPQAYSTHSVSTSKGTCGSWPRGNWIYEQDTYGATEGGSSGSPVLNSSGQVVGQLSGACGTNPSNPCASSSNATVDGAFASYFSSVESYLDPTPGGGGCHVGSPGDANYCSSSCPCDAGYGDCDSNSECNAGLVCATDTGPAYGYASWVDVCQAGASCAGYCGTQSPAGCWCDSSCSFYGDCCSDKVAICG